MLGRDLYIQPGKGYSITTSRPDPCPEIPMIFVEHSVAATPFDDRYRLGSTMEFTGYDDRINRKRLGLLERGASHYLKQALGDTVHQEWCGWRPMAYNGIPTISQSKSVSNAFIAAASTSSVLVIRHRPDERRMPELMASASVLVHLSDDELTPVTPLEAFASGRPVVASRLPAFVEALEDEAQLVDTATVVEDPSGLADALGQALRDVRGGDAEARRRALAARYTWVDAARATVAAWWQVLADDAAGPSV
jgi:glycosyltransferase involved in cell wall biosynthesis